VSRKYLLDSSFLIDLLNEAAEGEPGPAARWLQAHPKAALWISPVTLAEVLEGAEDIQATRTYLARYRWQGIHRTHAEHVAIRQVRSARRMGENDAWQAAVAECMGATVLGHDRGLAVLGAGYEDFR
jgi:predicted nucleic acid-binding protein